MGCCSSRPTESEITREDDINRPRIRQPSLAITSQTAINHTGHDRQPHSFGPRSGTSIRHSEVSHSPTSTPRPSSTNNQTRSETLNLAEHYNLPLKSPKTWSSKSRTWSSAQLARERCEFFETRVTGRADVWDALRRVAECIREGDISTSQGILDAVGVTLPTGRLEDGGYDEIGNLYKIPEPVLSDPDNVINGVNGSGEEDVDTTLGSKTNNDDEEMTPAVEEKILHSQELPMRKIREDKGKAVIEKDALKVRCRLSDRGGPDVIVLLGRGQTVRVLAQRIRDEGEVSNGLEVKVAYLGRILNEDQTLAEQDWKEGHVINALVVGFASS